MTRALSYLAGALIAQSLATAAFAGSVLQPGITVGIPAGSELAEGVYFTNTTDYGMRTNTDQGRVVDLPVLVYATPLELDNTRLQFHFSQPTASDTGGPNDKFFLNSSLLSAQLAHTVFDGLGVSYLAGIRLRAPSPSFGFQENSFEQRGAISYTANGFDVTADVINGIFGSRTAYPGWINVDLTATKRFGNVEIGPVAFGSTDTDRPFRSYKIQQQIAVGGLIGYHIGKLTLQAYATRSVAIRNYVGYDTRGWVRFALPLYQPDHAATPIVARY